jgi:hypothetical protein
MSPRTLVLGAVGAGCIVAAGVGGFVAMRLSEPARGAEAPVASAAVPSPVVAPTPVVPAPPEPAVLLPATEREAPRTKIISSGRSETNARPSQKANPPAVISAVPTPAAAPPPGSSATTQTPVPTPAAELPPPPPPPDEVAPAPVKEAPKPRFDELTVTENSVIGIHLDSTVSSDTAKVEDKVTARVSRDVLVSGRTAIPAGSKLEGNVTLVEHGGKFKDKARLGIRFTTLVLPDNTRQTIQTDALFRDGESPTGEATAKVGASAAVGAIIGAAIGGKKGAALGSMAGAAGGAGIVQAGGRNDAIFAAGTPLTVRLTSPITVMVERDQDRDR